MSIAPEMQYGARRTMQKSEKEVWWEKKNVRNREKTRVCVCVRERERERRKKKREREDLSERKSTRERCAMQAMCVHVMQFAMQHCATLRATHVPHARITGQQAYVHVWMRVLDERTKVCARKFSTSPAIHWESVGNRAHDESVRIRDCVRVIRSHPALIHLHCSS